MGTRALADRPSPHRAPARRGITAPHCKIVWRASHARRVIFAPAVPPTGSRAALLATIVLLQACPVIPQSAMRVATVVYPARLRRRATERALVLRATTALLVAPPPRERCAPQEIFARVQARSRQLVRRWATTVPRALRLRMPRSVLLVAMERRGTEQPLPVPEFAHVQQATSALLRAQRILDCRAPPDRTVLAGTWPP